MKKKGLLTFAALSILATASAARYDIIKDGKLMDGIEQMAYEDEVFDSLNEEDGTYTHPGGEALYKDVRLDFTKAASMPDLSQTWVLNIEYEVGDDLVPTAKMDLIGDKKPAFIIALFDKNNVLTDEGFGEIDPTRGDACVYIDAKYGERTAKRTFYVFANPNFKDVACMSLGYCREASIATTAKIKNLYLYSDNGTKPFYAENFDGVGAGRLDIWTGGADLTGKAAEKLSGGHKLTNPDGDVTAPVVRLWEADGVDGGGQFYDAEQFQALQITPDPEVCDPVLVKDIAIPANDGKLYASAAIKYKWVEGEDFDMDAANEKLDDAITITFNDEKNTTVGLFAGYLLEAQWGLDSCAIDIPAGATACTVTFGFTKKYNYCVDNFMLSVSPNVEVEEAAAEANNVVVYPNPASDVVKVSGQVDKIEVVNVAGAVVATANANSVNVAALPAGIYFVKAYNANNVVVKSIIKK